MKRLSTGKVPIRVLDATVLRLTGAPSKFVVTPPKAGLDFAAVRSRGGYLIVSADPITGVETGIGEYAVSVSANDVATSGNRPQFMESVILLPEGATADYIAEIAAQMDGAARRLGVTILGGHTEVSPGLRKPIVVTTMFAFARKYVTSADARPGDTLMMTKTAGVEGTAALASARGIRLGLDAATQSRARRFIERLSVVEEAEAAYATGRVDAMHDCTEGGVLGAAFEMSLASNVGFVLRRDSVPVDAVTQKVCARAGVDPMMLIGSGSLLLSVQRGREEEVKMALGGGSVTEVGEFVKGRRVLVEGDGTEVVLEDAPEDELWRVLGRHA